MNKSFYILFFVFFLSLFQNTFIIAQTNLVYNGDFELYDTCPVNVSSPWDMQIATCYGWRAPTSLGTSDYFNICHSTTYLVGIPQNFAGYEFTFSGNGYCGFYAHLLSDAVPDGHYTEYIQGQLLYPLVANRIYHFTAYASLSDGSAMALDQLGAYFSSSPVSRSDHKPFNLIPQAILTNGGYLTDTMNWMKLEVDFKANGGEQYLTLGNFRDTASTDTLRLTPFDPTGPDYTAYYYIDNLSLTEKEDPETANIFTPNEDGNNDLFSIQGLGRDDNVLIFNRWGIKIYEFSGIKDGWDGRTTSGEKCNDGVYYYIVKRKKEEETQKGFIQLVR